MKMIGAAWVLHGCCAWALCMGALATWVHGRSPDLQHDNPGVNSNASHFFGSNVNHLLTVSFWWSGVFLRVGHGWPWPWR